MAALLAAGQWGQWIRPEPAAVAARQTLLRVARAEPARSPAVAAVAVAPKTAALQDAEATAGRPLLTSLSFSELSAANVFTFSSIAELRSADITADAYATVVGYYSIGDAEVTYYRADTVAPPATYTDNGATIIVPTGGDGSSAWLMVIVNDTVSVDQCGARGDTPFDATNAIITALSVATVVKVPAKTYKTTQSIVVPVGKRLEGASLYFSALSASNVNGPVLTFATGNHLGGVSNIRLKGTATSGLKVSNSQLLSIDRINLSGLTAPDGFIFERTWGSSFCNLYTAGATITNASFICGGEYNGNKASNWYSSNICTYNLYIDTFYTQGASLSHSNSFDNVVAQGGRYGIWVGAARSLVFNGIYTENVVTPLKLGDFATNKQAVAITLFGADLAHPQTNHPQYALRAAIVELDYAIGVSIVAPQFTGLDGTLTYAQLFFSGGGGSGAIGVARVNVDGTLHSAEVLCGGDNNYTSPPTVTIGGMGTGGQITASLTGNNVGALTVINPGAGYVPTRCPVAVRYNYAYRCEISANYHGGGSLTVPLYPWVVRATGAASNAGVTIIGDTSLRGGGSSVASADLRKTQGLGYVHALVEYANTSPPSTVTTRYIPPLFA